MLVAPHWYIEKKLIAEWSICTSTQRTLADFTGIIKSWALLHVIPSADGALFFSLCHFFSSKFLESVITKNNVFLAAQRGIRICLFLGTDPPVRRPYLKIRRPNISLISLYTGLDRTGLPWIIPQNPDWKWGGSKAIKIDGVRLNGEGGRIAQD